VSGGCLVAQPRGGTVTNKKWDLAHETSHSDGGVGGTWRNKEGGLPKFFGGAKEKPTIETETVTIKGEKHSNDSFPYLGERTYFHPSRELKSSGFGRGGGSAPSAPGVGEQKSSNPD